MKMIFTIKIVALAMILSGSAVFADTVARVPESKGANTNVRDTSTQTGWQNQLSDLEAQKANTAATKANTMKNTEPKDVPKDNQ